ncbi:hypothetical protein BSKO_00046 [Bryopsis sp. KO-2023]|nr:hypothetical protein BSKO_00046 [Bryopsis sp. KO-2023]
MGVSVTVLFWCCLASIAAATSSEVTCGSVLKLIHETTSFRLHSHDLPYGSGSQQQSVTGFPKGDDTNSYWIVRGTLDAPCKQGAAIVRSQQLRLQHAPTRRWLHSHLHQSPLSQNQEVSAFGGDDESDTGDVWTIEWDSRNKSWERDTKVRFKHVDTGAFLLSHNRKYSNPIHGQQEVCAKKDKGKGSLWTAAEGIYFSEPSPPEHDEL